MEKILEIKVMFNNVFQNRKVLLTGHTGFKGSWLVAWLELLGAEVCGVALPMKGELNHIELLKLQYQHEVCDIRNLNNLKKIFDDFRPEIVFHLAAQPLVLESYISPVHTFETNVIGTVNVLECCRNTSSVRAVLAITSDKCYENNGIGIPFPESAPMGGFDPYSASKGCAELVISSYRNSFMNNHDFGKKHNCLIASARAGNVVGGGDWADCRLIPDLMRNAAAGKVTTLRAPESVRPWQHVLDPLSGYLTTAEKLFNGQTEFAEAWNFGPNKDECITVHRAALALGEYWHKIAVTVPNNGDDALHEAEILRLECSKARGKLKWQSNWNSNVCFEKTAKWYRDFYTRGKINTFENLSDYIHAAKEGNLEWIK